MHYSHTWLLPTLGHGTGDNKSLPSDSHINPPAPPSEATGVEPTQEHQFKLWRKGSTIVKKPCPSAKSSLQYPPSSPHPSSWTSNGNGNKYQKEMNEFLFQGSFSPHFSEILLYLHFKLIIFQLWCHNNSLATEPDEKSWDFCNSYRWCFLFCLNAWNEICLLRGQDNTSA